MDRSIMPLTITVPVEPLELTFEVLKPMHCSSLIKWHNDPTTRPFIHAEGMRRHVEMMIWEQRVHRCKPSQLIYLLKTDTYVGYCTGIFSGSSMEVGIVIDPEHREKDYAYYALGALSAVGFERGISLVTGRVMEHNEKSIRLVDKIGFEQVGKAENEFMYELKPESLRFHNTPYEAEGCLRCLDWERYCL